MIPPDFCIDGAVNQLRGFAGTAPAQTVLVTSLVRRLPEASEIPEADRAAFLTRAETIVRDEVLPALAAAHVELERGVRRAQAGAERELAARRDRRTLQELIGN